MIPWFIPGHDYIINNLQFTLSREPGNSDAPVIKG